MRTLIALIAAAATVAAQISGPVPVLIEKETRRLTFVCPDGHTCATELAPGHDSTSSITADGFYTAPAKAKRHGSIGGCASLPHNSIYNLKISDTTKFPKLANSDALVAGINAWAFGYGTFHSSVGLNMTPVTKSTPTTYMQGYYDSGGKWFGDYKIRTPQYLTIGSRDYARAGVTIAWGFTSGDNRYMSVDRDDCTITESYFWGAPEAAFKPAPTPNGSYANTQTIIKFNSLETLNGKGLRNSQVGSVAAGMWLAPMMMYETELLAAVDRDGERAVIPHMLAFTIPNTVIPIITLGIFSWPATSSAGGCTPNTPNCGPLEHLTPYGTRFRLPQSFIDTFPYTKIANVRQRNMMRAFHNTVRDYGVLVMDGTLPADTGGMYAVSQGLGDPDWVAFLDNLKRSKLNGWGNPMAAMEAIDESGVMVDPGSNIVRDPIAGPELVLLRDTTTGQVIDRKDIVINPPTIGADWYQFNIIAGAPALNLAAGVWATGLCNNKALTWRILTPNAPGSISFSGIYNPPATLAAPTELMVRAASAQDPTVYTDLRLVLYPQIGPTGLRISSYKQTDYVDAQGHTWWAVQGADKRILNPFKVLTYGNIVAVAPDATYPARAYQAGGYDEQVGLFYLPQGSYKITTLAAVGGSIPTTMQTQIDFNGQVAFAPQSLYELNGHHTNTGVAIPANVTIPANGQLVYGWRTQGPFSQAYPYLSSIVIEKN